MFTMKNQRQYRSRQGRTDQQYESDAKILYYTICVAGAAILLVMALDVLGVQF